jgi:hypothetical protein
MAARNLFCECTHWIAPARRRAIRPRPCFRLPGCGVLLLEQEAPGAFFAEAGHLPGGERDHVIAFEQLLGQRGFESIQVLEPASFAVCQTASGPVACPAIDG